MKSKLTALVKRGNTMWRRKRGDGRSVHTSMAEDPASPRERYEEFARENGRVKRDVEEALAELDELARAPEERQEETG
jgi:hypothetical protein